MDTISSKFEKEQSEFIKSNASEKSIENLYDIIYSLKEITEKKFEENYILACAYELIGKNINALKIIDNVLHCNTNEFEIRKLSLLKEHIKSKDRWNNKIYRDLRDARIIKLPTIIHLNNFVVSKDRNEYCIGISEEIKNIVLLNKNVKIDDLWLDDEKRNIAFSQNEPTKPLLIKLINYIEWLGQVKDELLNFYNSSISFEGKIYDVGQEWYDGLRIFDFHIAIDKNENFEAFFIIYDYLQNNYGFHLEIKNRNINSIEYDGNL